jgi:hypothetical protein
LRANFGLQMVLQRLYLFLMSSLSRKDQEVSMLVLSSCCL